MKTTRTYTQTARAAAAEETRLRILGAAFELQTERLSSEISLDDVAERAGVSVQTLLRRFGNRAGLIEASIRYANEEIVDERRAPVGDREAALRVLVDHYERRGDFALLMLAQENSYDHVRQMSDAGKVTHRRWVAEVFAPDLDRLPADAAEQVLDLLVVATDVYTWKLLRRDRGLSRPQTERRMNTLVAAVLATATDPKDT
ncbi:TetR/AcrR family transcriptional regulator [Marmoricola sp. RAF53]|uniref:TetR/AcrR family transcriptional regulator n=1 Tax=Marmoricola sp. RAF53 TaxID=3233059 RepID=UPI003F98F700